MPATERQKQVVNKNAHISAELLKAVLDGNKKKAMELIQEQRTMLEALELEVR